MMREWLAVCLAGVVSVVAAGSVRAQSQAHWLYLAGRNGAVVGLVADSALGAVPLPERWVHLKARARAGEPERAWPELARLLAAHPRDAEAHVAAGVAQHAFGRMAEAQEEATRALELDPQHGEAWLLEAHLRAYRRDWEGAGHAVRQAFTVDSPLAATGFGWYAALALAQRSGRLEEVGRLYELRARGGLGAVPDSAAAVRDLETGAMYRRAGSTPAYAVSMTGDRVELPMGRCAEGSPYFCVRVRTASGEYGVLIDTGNSGGWSVHAPGLLALPHDSGGVASTVTGSVQGTIPSRRIVTHQLDVGALTIRNLPGVFMPKPRPDYFDAVLNPFHIRDHVVTLDFVRERMIVRTRERFAADLARSSDVVMRTPVLEFDWFYIPVRANGKPALAMIETGAEELSMTQQFARRNGIALEPRTRSWQGREYAYGVAELTLDLDGHVLAQQQVEAWPVRFRDQLSGMSHDIMIGPGFLAGKYVLSLDPFANQLVLERAR